MSQQVACVQMTSTHDLQANLAMAEKLIGEAVRQEAKLIVLPEMFAVMGMDASAKAKFIEPAGSGPIQDFLRATARRHGVWLVGGTISLADSNGDRARAACLVMDDKGNQVARYDKIHLFDVYVDSTKETYSESTSIEPGNEVVVVPTPFGRLGLAVCYDLRFPEFFRRMQEQGAEMVAIPTAFTYATGVAHWEVLVRARAIENLIYMIAACQTGTHPNNRKTYGHSMIVNPWGEVRASLVSDPGVVVGQIDLGLLHQLRQDFPVLKHRKF